MPFLVSVAFGIQSLTAFVSQAVVAHRMAASGTGSGITDQPPTLLHTVKCGIKGAGIKVNVTASQAPQLFSEVEAVALSALKEGKKEKFEITIMNRHSFNIAYRYRKSILQKRTDSAGEIGWRVADWVMLRPEKIPEVPAETARIARAAFPKGSPFIRLRDELGIFLTDSDFSALYPHRGQPAAAPWRLMLISVMQYVENLTDRQAADAVRGHLVWKVLSG